MDTINLVGSIAAICTTISFLPQVMRINRTKRTHDLSLPTYIIFALGVFMWLCYGIMINSFPVIAANAIIAVFVIYIVVMKIKYR